MATQIMWKDVQLTAAQQDYIKHGGEYYQVYIDGDWPPTNTAMLQKTLENAVKASAHTSVTELRGLLRKVRQKYPDHSSYAQTTHDLLMDNSEAVAAKMQEVLGKANNELLLIEYPAIGRTLALPGTLLTFEDRYRPKFSKEEVYGRMDPIVSYQNTSRSITLGWEINFADGDVEWAYAALNDLAKMMYPVYHEANFDRPGTGTLVAAPLLRFSLKTPSGGTPGNWRGASLEGILGAVDTFDFMKMKANPGDFNMIRQPGSGLSGVILPINLMVTISFTVLHEGAKVGWVWSQGATITTSGTTAGSPDASIAQASRDTTTTLTFGQGAGYPYGLGSTIENMSEGTPVSEAGEDSDRADARSRAAADSLLH